MATECEAGKTMMNRSETGVRDLPAGAVGKITDGFGPGRAHNGAVFGPGALAAPPGAVAGPGGRRWHGRRRTSHGTAARISA